MPDGARRAALLAATLAAMVLAAFAWPAPASGQLQARVVGVQDEDTLSVLGPNRGETRVRLVEIDAPELGQPYGRKSRQVLSALVFGKTVQLRREGEDRYGRTLARIYVGGTDVNAEMVRQGAAWVYTAYNKDPAFPPLQARARRERLGLWALQADQITPPWEWRRDGRSGAGEPGGARDRLSPPPSPRSYACVGKTRCAQMSSCGEARFYLRQCAADRLDGDKDGVPCEAICR